MSKKMPWHHGELDLQKSTKNNLQWIVIFFIATMALDSKEAENRFQAQSNKKKKPILFREETQAQFSNSPIL
jgi:hypothetical protein